MRLTELIGVIDTDQMVMIIFEPVDKSRVIITECSVENVIDLLEYNLIHSFLYVTGIYMDCDDVMNIYVKKELPEDEYIRI